MKLVKPVKPVVVGLVMVGLFALFLACGKGGGGSDGSGATLEGQVIGEDNTPLSLATVTVGGITTTTNYDGRYTLQQVSVGTQTLQVSLSGYLTYSRSFQVGNGTNYVPLVVMSQKNNSRVTIGPEGGSGTSLDGEVTAVFPSGALSSAVEIAISTSNLGSGPAAAPSGFSLAYLFQVSPEVSLASGTSATFTLPRPTSVSSGETVYLYHFDTAGQSWELITSGTAGQSTIEIAATKIGWLAIMTQIPTGSIHGAVYSSTQTIVPRADVWINGQSVRAGIDGAFSFSGVLPGSLEVYARSEGYELSHQSVTVTGGGTASLTFFLTPLPGGAIQGYVRYSQTSLPIEGGRVTLTPGGSVLTDSTGRYEFLEVGQGDYTVRAFASGYVASDSASVEVRSSTTTTQNFALTQTSSPSEFTETGESGQGSWQITGGGSGVTWQLLDHPEQVVNTFHPTYVSLPGGTTQLPSAYSGTHAWWYGQTSTGSYIGEQSATDQANSGGTSRTPTNGSLTSGRIDLSNYAQATFSFQTWWEIEGVNPATGFDKMKVEVSIDDGSSWTLLALLNPQGDPDPGSKSAYLAYTSAGFNRPGTWVRHVYDLTPYVGSSQVKVRFTFDAFDAQYNGFRGWLLDDIKVNDDLVSLASLSVTSSRAWLHRPQALPRR